MADYVYTLSRHRWVDDYFAPPEGAVATLDLRSLIDCGTAAIEREAVFCAMPAGMTLDDSHHVLGRGDLRDLRLSATEQSAWESVTGYRPQGDTLNDWLADHLLAGTDPTGLDRCKPLMPTIGGSLEIILPGHSRVWSQSFVFGVHPHTNQLQAVLQEDFRFHFQAEQAGHAPQNHAAKVLDYWCDKFLLNKRNRAEWQRLVPPSLRRDISGPVPHATTITDNFTRADGDTIGNLLTWTEDAGDWDTLSNQVVISGAASCSCHPTTALSGTDHYSQISLVARGTSNAAADRIGGATSRWQDASNFYFCGLGNAAGSTAFRLYKRVAGTNTQLGTDGTVTVSLPDPVKMHSNGSTQTGYYDGSAVANATATDTALTSGTTCGLWARFSGSSPTFDDFEAADLAASFAGRLIGGRLVGGHLTRSRLVGI